MKERFIFVFVTIFLLAGCSNLNDINFLLKNETEYKAVLVDKDINKTEIVLEPFEERYIKHTNSSNFTLKETNNPIIVYNAFDFCVIKNAPSYELLITNKTENNYILNINNNIYCLNYEIEKGANNSIKIFTKKPIIKLITQSGITYNNFIYQDNKLLIY